ncbi:type II toxin-antitoxin system prevent-host-death family antitoxin [Thermus thermophilus]|uniref:type II toxin-antitoxin system Phd/YefM family antitoxin n=1 Tax=Thermus thermophilus TaxID=274 RepID=UPI001CC7D7FA
MEKRAKSVGVRELKAHLSRYLRLVRAGSVLVVTERGKPLGRLVPLSPDPLEALRGLAQVGVVRWSGQKPRPRKPVAKAKRRPVADLLLEERR